MKFIISDQILVKYPKAAAVEEFAKLINKFCDAETLPFTLNAKNTQIEF
jgi:hypothetical protein